MKKVISILLALIALVLPLCLTAVADDEEPLTTVYYVQLPEACKQYSVVPLEGYSTYDGTGVYVQAGNSFKFQVIPNEGYSVQMLQVSYYDTEKEKSTTEQMIPMKAPDTFTIEAVNADTTVAVDYVMQEQKAIFFRRLIEFVRNLFSVIMKFFGSTAEI